MNDHDSSTSKFLVDDYEGISSDFIEMEPLPSREGYCDLFKAKRYGRWYLLKCLKEKEATYPVYQQMFRKEFEISVALQHQSVVQVTGLETVKLPDGRTALCIISEWIDGVTLSEYLKGASGSSEPSVNERRRVAEELAEAVAYIHSQQVVHRDLKPSNIMITNNGNYVKVIDFGLADTSSHAILKQPAGTMRYMAPEQMQTSMADVRNDIYSLGVILQEMNLGGGKYRRVVERCLRPMEQRYQQMDDLLKDLHSRRGQYLMWGGVAAVVVAVVTLLLWQVSSLQRRSAQMEKEAAEQQLQLKILNHEIIGFDDPEVQRLCVAHWDTDGDGQLSYKEAAAVDSLGQVFTGNKKILSFDELENFTGLTAIDANAFRDCESLQSVRLPISVRFIRSNAFRGCDQLEYIRMPDDLAVLGDSAFEGCRELSEVSFDGNAPSIGQDVFRSCGSHMVLTYQKAKGGWSTPLWQGYASYPVHIHDQSGEVIKAASADEDGRVDAVCSVCGKWTCRSIIDRIDPDSLTCQDDLTYTGKAQYPKVTVRDVKENLLVEGTDYSLEYSGNVNAGTGTVRVIFQGRYTGTMTREFTIRPKDLSQAAIVLSQSSYTFDGKAKQPAVSISGLSGGTDYTVTYKNNTNAGTATVNASGKGNYCGTASATFRIAPAGISGWSISLSAASYAYTGTVRKPTVRITGIQAEDYLVKYSNASSKNVGTYTVTVSGRRNYTGSRSLTYTIKPKATSISSLTAASKAFTVKWKKVSAQATGYQIQYSTSSTFASGNKTVNITSYKTVSKKVTSLKASKKYYVRVRTYKTVGTKTYYSAWSAKKGITTKQ